jgi:hypothetical protein
MTEKDKPTRGQGDAKKVVKKEEPSKQPKPDKKDRVIKQSHLIERFDPDDNGRD